MLTRIVLVSALLGMLGGAPAATAAVAAAVWPLDPPHPVVREFDPPAEPWLSGHRGVDLLGTEGQPVYAAAAGTVTYAGELAGRGVVVVDHGTTRTTYEPVRAGVDRGDRVSAGDRIGRLQRGGSHCRPRVCLHWGWLAGDTYRDPLSLVGAGPVRLLPMLLPRGPGTLPGEAHPPGERGEGERFGRDRAAAARGTSAPRLWPGRVIRSWFVLTRADAPGGRPGAAGRW